jgi:hypothetical protein
MAIRKTTHVLKNSDIVNRPLPTILKSGEPIVNTADGILYMSGVTTSTSEWTPAGTGTTANFFEVGSNLYDLALRNRITKYEGASGAGLVGKFLSGTTNGFVLADISSISGVDSFVTGGTYNGSDLVLNINNGQPSVTVTGFTDDNDYTTAATLIGSVAYFDRTDALSAYTLDLSSFISTGDTYTTGFTYDDANNITIERNQGLGNLSVNIDTMTGLTVNGTLLATTISATTYQGLPTDVYVTGGTLNAGTVTYTNTTGGTFQVTGFSNDLDTYVTGGTVSIPATDDTNSATIGLFYKNSEGPHTLPFENTYITGGTMNGTNLELDKNDGVTEIIDLSSLADTDTVITAFTYDNANEFTITDSAANSFQARIDTMTGLTVNGDVNITGQTTVCDVLPQNTWNINGGCDIGAVGSRFNNVYARFLKLGTSTTELGDDGVNFTMTGTNGNFIFMPAVDMEVHADVLPDVDLTRDLGAVGQRWKELHAGNISATGLTLTNLTAGRVVYVGTGGELTDEAGFEYNAGSDTLLAGNINTAAAGSGFIGTGGLTVGSGGNPSTSGTGDVVIHGNLTVFGDAITASTGQLYVEDNQITLNYNPTGDTSATSVGAGWLIQDGDGANADVNFDIRAMNGFTGLTGTEIPDITEYTGPTGYENRAFVTQLNDIVIRSTDVTTPDGVRVLAEFDCLDGGTY